MALSSKNLAGPGYIILNVIRFMNAIGLLAVAAACIVMLVKTSTESRFFFFDAVSNVITVVISMFLLITELPWFAHFIERNWPLLGSGHSFVTLAVTMIILGIKLLGDLNKPATSQENMGMAFWRIVIGAGIVIFILGWLNLIASYLFRDRKNFITARQVRADGAVASQKTPRSSSGTPPASYIMTPQKTGGSNAFHIRTSSRRQESDLPSYNTGSVHNSPTYMPSPPYARKESDAAPVSPTSRYSRLTNCSRKITGMMGRGGRQSIAPPLPINPQMQHHQQQQQQQQAHEPEISGPMGVNPQFAHLVQRPDSALHPSRSGTSEAYRWKT